MLELFGFAWVTITFACCVAAVSTRRSVRRWLAARADRRRHDDTVEIVRRPLRKVATYAALVVLAVPAGVYAGGGALPGPSGGGGGLPTTGGDVTGQVVFSGVTTDISTGTDEDLTLAPAGTGDVVVPNQLIITGDTSAGVGSLRIRPADEDLHIALCDASNVASPEVCSAMQHYNVSTTISGTLFGNNIYLDSASAVQRYNTNFGSVYFQMDSRTTAANAYIGMTHPGGSNAVVFQCATTGATTATCTMGSGHTTTFDVRGNIENSSGSVTVNDRLLVLLPGTVTNCSDGAGAAACSAAPAGAVVVDDGATTVVVSTTAVTANSDIMLTYDSSLGARLGVTCNTNIVQPTVSAKTAATSFTVTLSADPAGADPACLTYSIVN